MTFSLHGVKRKLLLAAAAAAAVLLILFTVSNASGSEGVPGESSADRISFLNQCGWQTEKEPESSRDVSIPVKFSKVYENYNALNLKSGFDLHKLEGKTCKQYVYKVTNYTGKDEVRATLLVCEKKIVGGDISTAALDGFMKPLRQVSSGKS